MRLNAKPSIILTNKSFTSVFNGVVTAAARPAIVFGSQGTAAARPAIVFGSQGMAAAHGIAFKSRQRLFHHSLINKY
jgi:hypothetical protein